MQKNRGWNESIKDGEKRDEGIRKHSWKEDVLAQSWNEVVLGRYKKLK